jgi:hypothetical protein
MMLPLIVRWLRKHGTTHPPAAKPAARPPVRRETPAQIQDNREFDELEDELHDIEGDEP